MRKRIWGLFLLLFVAVLLFACGEGAAEQSTEPPADVSASTSAILSGTNSVLENSSAASAASSYTDGVSLTDPEDSSAESEESMPISSEPTQSEENSAPPEESSQPIVSEPEESSSETSSAPETSVPEESGTDTKPSSPPPVTQPHEVNGFLVVNYRAMEQFGGTAASGELTAQLMNRFKERVGSDVNVYAMPIPLASSFYAPEGYTRSITNTQNCFYGLRDALVNVQFVDAYAALLPHTEEEIYARTDHHWFALGAYYAAEAFCKTAGANFASLSQFKRYASEGFLGSAYSAYGVSELAKYPETFVWYEPKQSCTVNYYTQRFQFSSTGSMFASNNSYTKFIRGDGNAVQIQTGVNNGRRLLVIKDSFGNALAPFLIAGFEEVYFVDIREFACNILTFIDEQQITDVAFAVSAFTVSGSKRDNITRLMNI